MRLYSRAKFEAWNDQLRLATIAAWNGQLFHGRLMSREGLKSSAIDEVLPRKRKTAEEKRAERDADMARRVLAMGGKIVKKAAPDAQR